jgi:NRPS condensation-like uncharacterized protein
VWEQFYDENESNHFTIQEVNLTACSLADARIQVESVSLSLKSSLNIENGPLLGVVQFRLQENNLLLIVAHHLVMDLMKLH